MEQEFRHILQQDEFVAGSELLLGVSGGVDSVVLLDLLMRVAPEFELKLRVLHLDHQIRPESADDTEFVMRLCRELGVPCQVVTVDVAELAANQRISLETAGRDARREALTCMAQECGCARIVLAHHRDDQAETFLQRLLRGTGLSGLQAMCVQAGVWWRPLLSFSRQQILEYATEHKLEWTEDASNRDPAFLRNRIRHQLIPQLSEYNPQIVERLATLSRQLQSEEDYWQKQVDSLWPEILLTTHDGVRLNITRIKEIHPAMQMRLFRKGLCQVRGHLNGIEAVHLEALLNLLHEGQPQAELDLPGCWVARRYDQLWFRSQPVSVESFDLSLEVGASLALPDGRILSAEYSDSASGEDACRVEFDADLVPFPLRVRSLLAGDRFRPSGMTGQRKVKDILIDLKLEKEQRRALPLLVGQDEILWLAGLRRSVHAPVAETSRKILVVQLLKATETVTNAL